MSKYEFVISNNHPTIVEEEFLTVLYDRFKEIQDLIFASDFKNKESIYRLFLLKELYSIYSEVTKYQPIKDFIDGGEFNLLNNPMLLDFFKNLRHLLSHFPLSNSYKEIQFKKSWLTAFDNKSKIAAFLSKYAGTSGKLTLKSPYTNNPIRTSISVPIEFEQDVEISLNDIMNEGDCCLVCTIILALILGKQLTIHDIPFDKNKSNVKVKTSSGD